jgi:hypothetical protein
MQRISRGGGHRAAPEGRDGKSDRPGLVVGRGRKKRQKKKREEEEGEDKGRKRRGKTKGRKRRRTSAPL